MTAIKNHQRLPRMKSLLIALTLCAALLITTSPAFSQEASSADAAWAGYFVSLKTAVTKHDQRALKALIASRIQYEDGTVSDTRFVKDFGSEGGQLLNALNSGTVSGNGAKRLLKSEAAEVEFVFAKGHWYLKVLNVGG